MQFAVLIEAQNVRVRLLDESIHVRLVAAVAWLTLTNTIASTNAQSAQSVMLMDSSSTDCTLL